MALKLNSEKSSLPQIKESIKERVDLGEIVGRHTKLTKSGQGYKGCCPLPGHKEKTPSFFVNTRDNYFYCYGCSRGGDVFTFLNLVEGLSFMDALKELAASLNIELPKSSAAPEVSEREKSERQAGFEILARAAKFFHRVLLDRATPGATAARTYLDQRGIVESEIIELGLGWAPEEGSALVRRLGASNEKAHGMAVGLIRDYGDRAYDFFRDRLMIPIHDSRGRPIAFSGRTLNEVTGENPKYKNSPESDWFKKKEVLYGLDRASKIIRNENYVCIVEGYFDQWAFQRREIPSVAVMGTALTEEHLSLLGRHTKQVILVLDTDAAGVASTKKSLPLLLERGWDVKIFSELAGKDPDEWLTGNAEQPEALRQKLLGAPEALEWWAKVLLKEAAGLSLNRLQTLKSLLGVWELAKSVAHKNILADEVGRFLGLAANEIKESLDDLRKASSQTGMAGRAKPTLAPETLQTNKNFFTKPLRNSAAPSPIDRIAERVFIWWIRHWELLTPKTHQEWEDREKLFHGSLAEKLVLEMGAAWYRNSAELTLDYVRGALANEGLDETLRHWILRGLVSPDAAPMENEDDDRILISFNEFAAILRKERVNAEILRLQAEMRMVSGDADATARLLQKAQDLRMSLEKRK